MKICNKHNQNKIQRRNGRWRCKLCDAEYSNAYYKLNKKDQIIRVAARNKKVVDENRALIYEYLLKNHCIDCGESDPIVLQFDHRENKLYDVSRLVSGYYSWNKIIQEIQKCDIRCANCHARKTAKSFGYYRFNRAK